VADEQKKAVHGLMAEKRESFEEDSSDEEEF
jgi:hypothetical protein